MSIGTKDSGLLLQLFKSRRKKVTKGILNSLKETKRTTKQRLFKILIKDQSKLQRLQSKLTSAWTNLNAIKIL